MPAIVGRRLSLAVPFHFVKPPSTAAIYEFACIRWLQLRLFLVCWTATEAVRTAQTRCAGAARLYKRGTAGARGAAVLSPSLSAVQCSGSVAGADRRRAGVENSYSGISGR